MNPQDLRQRLARGEKLVGFAVTYPAPGILETIGRDWDFVWIDAQHGQISYHEAMQLVRTADFLGLDTLLRVPGREFGVVGPFADMAPAAIMMPMVDTPADAAEAVRVSRFPPLGTRSFGGRRAVDLHSRDYYLRSEPVLVAQLETPLAIENARKIAETDGIDGLMFGPDDFKVGLGINISSALLETPVLKEALQKTAEAATAAGKFAVAITPTPEMVDYAKELGFQLFIGGSDSHFLRATSNSQSTMLRAHVGQSPRDAR